MAKLYVIKTGQTTFEQAERVESTAGAPLTPQGESEVRAAANELAKHPVDAIYASGGESEQQTARLVGKIVGAKIRTVADLSEIDYGLWQGLTIEEIKRRQPKVYRQWSEVPTTICPPGGETLTEVRDRITKAVEGIFHRRKKGTPLLVLRPVAMGVLRCLLEKKPPDKLWEQTELRCNWCSYEIDGISL